MDMKGICKLARVLVGQDSKRDGMKDFRIYLAAFLEHARKNEMYIGSLPCIVQAAFTILMNKRGFLNWEEGRVVYLWCQDGSLKPAFINEVQPEHIEITTCKPLETPETITITRPCDLVERKPPTYIPFNDVPWIHKDYHWRV